MNSRTLAYLLVSASLVGCGSSQKVIKPIQQPTSQIKASYYVEGIEDPNNKAPEHMRNAVLGHLKQEMESKGLLAKDRSQANRVVMISVTSYRMRSGFSRATFGFIAGKDGMEAKVTVRDASTNEVMGESEVSCYSIAAVGGEEDIAKMEAEEIVKYLAGKSD